VGVLDASTIRTLSDLKGKDVGIPNLGSGVVPFVKAIVQREGMDPNKDVSLLPVGLGAQAATALLSNRVAALAFFDAAFASIENLGHKIRYLRNDLESNLYGVVIAFSEDFIKRHPKAVAGFSRGIAKATLFALTNPEAAVRMHTKMYPQYKSKAADEPTAMRHDLHIFERRAAAYRLESPELLWGSYDPKKWEIFQDFLLAQGALQAKLRLGEFFDDRFIKPANAFDREAVINAARAAK
jgi:NitT/TauT family transport system substrate-binding protein